MQIGTYFSKDIFINFINFSVTNYTDLFYKSFVLLEETRVSKLDNFYYFSSLFLVPYQNQYLI